MTLERHAEGKKARAVRIRRVHEGVQALYAAALAAEQEFAAELKAVHPSMRRSARNLVHYLGLRRHDIRDLQEELARLGLSSLGRMEAHVMASLQAVLLALHRLRGTQPEPQLEKPPALTFDAGEALLSKHADEILGTASGGLDARIMVTMPGEAADDPILIRELVRSGMGIMRVNCAHDGPAQWERMVRHLRRAERETGRRCLVSFDLAGPKLRTGPMGADVAVAKWRPQRDALGRVVEPARVRLIPSDGAAPPEGAIACAPKLLAAARPGDRISLTDARGRGRNLTVVEAAAGACVCEARKTAYVVPGTALVLHRRGRAALHGRVEAVPPRPLAIVLRPGDALELVLGDGPGRDAERDTHGRVLRPAQVSCALHAVFTAARAGDPILFDDGRIRGLVREALPDRLRLEITAAAGGAARLRAEKGINLPRSSLELPALTARDAEDLAFVARHGDMVALSFVRQPGDIEALIAGIRARDASRLGIILKIETRAAFECLPALLLAAMRDPPVAVMVARGDLGVEVGFERLSEVQEQILWICEAAHVPVIWATQVLESLAKGGMPSRAEVTDAAMASRAECVMLNKGPYIRETLRFLVDVLGRMEEHQYKKMPRLRRLHVSESQAAAARALSRSGR